MRQSHAKAAESWRALTGGDTSARALRSNVGKIWLDGLRRPSVDVSVPQVGAPAAWAAGYTGAGSTVAVLDTGIDDTHPDLAGQVVGRRDFTEDQEPGNDESGTARTWRRPSPAPARHPAGGTRASRRVRGCWTARCA